MRIIAFITGTSAIRNILLHLGESTAPARDASSLTRAKLPPPRPPRAPQCPLIPPASRRSG
jgi:hypothetical protein